MLELLLAQPLAVNDRPSARRQQPTVTQTELRQPLPVAHPIKPRILARAPDRGPLPAVARAPRSARAPPGMKGRQLARVARVGLDSIARPLRHQPWRDHLAQPSECIVAFRLRGADAL
jgi:hypothetical protein